MLTYALFPQVGSHFIENRDNPGAFEPPPDAEPAKPAAAAPAASAAPAAGPAVYDVRINNRSYTVEVAESGQLAGIAPAAPAAAPPAAAPAVSGTPVPAMLAGNVFKVLVAPGDAVSEGDALVVIEAMKMETQISAPQSGTIGDVLVAVGDSVAVGDTLVTIG